MSKGGPDKLKLAAELMSKGATMLSEPCPQCGGIQIRYHGRVYCTSHEDLTSMPASSTVSVEMVVEQMRDALLNRLSEATLAFSAEKDGAKQDQLVSLMMKCFELLQKLPQK